MGQIDNDILNLFAAVKEFKLFHFGHLTQAVAFSFCSLRWKKTGEKIRKTTEER